MAFLEDMMWAQGYLDRPQMSGAFAAIRSEDLICSRAVRRYFLGEPDLPADMTVWVNDRTRMTDVPDMGAQDRGCRPLCAAPGIYVFQS